MNVDPAPGELSTRDPPAHRRGELGDDREPETGADGPVGAVAIPEVEALERAAEIVGREARAVVDARRAARARRRSRPCRRAGVQRMRVLDEVRERLQRPTGVGDRPGAGSIDEASSSTPYACACGLVAAPPPRARPRRGRRRQRDVERAAAQAREVEEIADQALEPLRLPLDHLAGPLGGRRRRRRAPRRGRGSPSAASSARG